MIPLLVLVGLFSIYSRFSAESMAPLPVSSFNQEEVSTPQATTFIRQCDGRQHCSQMTSCEEATWFLQNCPNTKMDGEGDGIPWKISGVVIKCDLSNTYAHDVLLLSGTGKLA